MRNFRGGDGNNGIVEARSAPSPYLTGSTGQLRSSTGLQSDTAANAVVRSRISAEVKEKATAVLGEMGLTVSDVMRIVLTRVAKEEALPFDLRPNKLTQETMRNAAQGLEVNEALDAADLFDNLGI